jgi:hypothetical protein
LPELRRNLTAQDSQVNRTLLLDLAISFSTLSLLGKSAQTIHHSTTHERHNFRKKGKKFQAVEGYFSVELGVAFTFQPNGPDLRKSDRGRGRRR